VRSIVGLLSAALLTAAACGSPDATPAAATAAAAERDVHSFARPEDARVTHVALDLVADFASKTLTGRATLTVERESGAREIVLDTRDLTVERVADSNGRALDHAFGDADPVLGRPLTVQLPDGVRDIVVSYHTSPTAEALQWLSPSQTAGGKLPYLYSQGQAILTRTWIPTQDSPAVRQSYSARIVVPRDLRAVMSAEQLTPEGREVPEGRAFEFRMTHRIPPYLIALGVGDIAFREIGPRTGVFAEPSVVDDAQRELADLEKMLIAAEQLVGPYRWERYDALVLPPSFPFGGMENPRLTFATPTILAGDRSLVSLMAHELAHSWSGNLVTNATWSDFWLNEGLTTYLENRIMEALFGPERASMLKVLERRELFDEIARLGGPESDDTMLHVNLKGRNPDDGMTQVPYAKGAALFRLLEETAGRERFDQYLRSYFDRFAFRSITTGIFFDDVRTHLVGNDESIVRNIRLEEWLYKPGLPDNAPVPESAALERVEQQASALGGGAPARSLKVQGWVTQEWQHFLGALPATLTPAQLRDLDTTFGLSKRGNSEVLFAWLRVAIRNHYEPAMPALERFLTLQGRRKFLRPLYEDLMATDWGKAEAKRIYARARPLYHSVSTSTLDPIVR
jgi:aminopeptidase N